MSILSHGLFIHFHIIHILSFYLPFFTSSLSHYPHSPYLYRMPLSPFLHIIHIAWFSLPSNYPFLAAFSSSTISLSHDLILIPPNRPYQMVLSFFLHVILIACPYPSFHYPYLMAISSSSLSLSHGLIFLLFILISRPYLPPLILIS